MFNKKYLGAVITALLAYSVNASAASDDELQTLRDRVQQLEQRDAAPQTSSAGAFNPAISVVLGGTYGRLGQPSNLPVTGFAMSTNPGHQQGFNLGETELGLSASIDPEYSGLATLSLGPTGVVSVENAFVQSSALGNGLNVKFGRYFSGLGYLNEQHAHVWDFVDQPLVYATLWNNQLSEDGVQLKWLAPTDRFIELGGEIGRGLSFPGTNTDRNGIGAGVLFAHIGDDIGIEHSWRAGVSLHRTRLNNAVSTNVPDLLNTPGGVTDYFNGNSQTEGLDFIWKYAPNGNIANRYMKLQGEYFRRKENGMLTYNLLTTDSYSNTQSGWYAQSVVQFMPNWRTGLRYDRLDPGVASVGALNAGNVISNTGFQPTRTSWMLDYSPSEFSRLRLQLARDNSLQALPQNQIFVQYVMSMGAHGAHQY